MGIIHATQVDDEVYPDDPGKPISTNAWNAAHEISGALSFTTGTEIAEDYIANSKPVLAFYDGVTTDRLQPHLGFKDVKLWLSAHGATSPSALGISAPTATGTGTAASMATTNTYTRTPKVEYLVTVASTTAVAGWRAGNTQCSIGSGTAGVGGFAFVCTFGPATGVSTSTNRCFVGLTNSTSAPTDVEPSSITNIVGVGWDAADTNIQIMHRGASSITKVDTGIAVPTVDRTSVYRLQLYSPPGTTQSVAYEFTDVVNNTVFLGSISTNMPSTTTLLTPRGWMSVGGTSSVIGIALSTMYLEVT